MTWGRAAAAGLIVWLIVLALLLQPHSHAPPRIEHARRLDLSPGSLPTLAP
jgi:hypothetical protein